MKISTILSDQDMADILLVWKDFKPAAIFEISYFENSKRARNDFLKEVEQLKKLLKKLDLKSKIRTNRPKSKNALTKFSIASKDQMIIERILAAEKIKNSMHRKMQIGKLIGYPLTAVKAFAKNESIALNSLPISVKRNKILKFLNFRLSKDWKKELPYLAEKAKILKKAAPSLYKKIRRFNDTPRSERP